MHTYICQTTSARNKFDAIKEEKVAEVKATDATEATPAEVTAPSEEKSV